MKTRIASLSLLTIVCLVLAVSPAMASTLYDNGAYNGTNDAWTINFGFAVSDSYSLTGGTDVTGMNIVYWDASSTDLLTTVDYQFGATSFSGSGPHTSAVSPTNSSRRTSSVISCIRLASLSATPISRMPMVS